MRQVEIIDRDLLLRPFRAADAVEVHQACRDPEIQAWTLLPSPYTRADAEAFVIRAAESWDAGTAARLGVFDTATGRLLGACGLVELDLRAGTAEVGYWTAAWARGRGTATRALRLVARWAFEDLGVRRIAWHAMVGNHGSRLVAERAGVQIEGTLREAMLSRDGLRLDTWVGSLLPRDVGLPPAAAEPPPPTAPTAAGSTAEARRAQEFSTPQPVLAPPGAGRSVLLRRPHPGDLDGMIAACRDPGTIHWTTVPAPYDRGHAEEFLRYAQTQWARGTGAVFTIAEPAGTGADRYAGTIDLRIDPVDPAIAEIGCLVAPEARGRGHASTALRIISAWGFDALALARIEWHAHVGNDSSRRAAEHAGFHYEGIARAGKRARDTRRDTWVLARLRTD